MVYSLHKSALVQAANLLYSEVLLFKLPEETNPEKLTQLTPTSAPKLYASPRGNGKLGWSYPWFLGPSHIDT